MNSGINIIMGLFSISVGSWALYAAIKNKMPAALEIWWLPVDAPGKDFFNRFLSGIVGSGFIIVGVFFILAGLWK